MADRKTNLPAFYFPLTCLVRRITISSKPQIPGDDIECGKDEEIRSCPGDGLGIGAYHAMSFSLFSFVFFDKMTNFDS